MTQGEYIEELKALYEVAKENYRITEAAELLEKINALTPD